MLKTQSNRQSRFKNVKSFAAIVGVLVGAFTLVLSIAAFMYVQTAVADTDSVPGAASLAEHAPPESGEPQAEPGGEGKGGFIANLLLPPEKTNFLVVGLDAGDSLTDVILVGSFDRETQKINVMSIPRDTLVTLSDEETKAMNDAGHYPPNRGIRVNSINSYGGRTDGVNYLRKHLEIMLGIEINYHAVVDIRAFRGIVDAVGGIWMDIPSGGLYYNDPDQGLNIAVPSGRQLLDGDMAEGVVRFRGTYRRGDLQRIEMQQAFMKEFFSQVISKESITKNFGSFMGTIITYVRTDFGLPDLPMYMRYVSGLSSENITFFRLPGEANDDDGPSYFYHDPELTAEMVQEVFFDTPVPGGETETAGSEEGGGNGETPSKGDGAQDGTPSKASGLRVQLLNGGVSEDDFSKAEEALTDGGVDVVETGSYTGTKKARTRVLARDAETAGVFGEYFPGISEEAGASLSGRFDAVIIVASPVG